MSLSLIFLLKATLAAALGFILGAQREKSGKAAGSRTMALVALGSAVFTIMSREGFVGIGTQLDPSRVAAQIVVGVGFLGAGTIIFQNDKISGLTTAATLWVAAALGMVVGNGFYLETVVLTVLVLLILLMATVQQRRGWLKK